MNPAGRSLKAQDIVVAYRTSAGTAYALNLDSFEVAAGESVAIMGPSGSGKSTLLGLLAGLATPTAGTITVGESVISSLSEKARIRFRRQSLGMLYQSDNLLPHLTVEENVGFQLVIAGLSADDGDVGAMLERLSLTELSARLPDQLSGGQRQRVAVARAVIHQPSIILADEPTGSLDPDNAEAVIVALKERRQEIGATLVVVTHDPHIASSVGRIVELPPQTRSSKVSHDR